MKGDSVPSKQQDHDIKLMIFLSQSTMIWLKTTVETLDLILYCPMPCTVYSQQCKVGMKRCQINIVVYTIFAVKQLTTQSQVSGKPCSCKRQNCNKRYKDVFFLNKKTRSSQNLSVSIKFSKKILPSEETLCQVFID